MGESSLGSVASFYEKESVMPAAPFVDSMFESRLHEENTSCTYMCVTGGDASIYFYSSCGGGACM